MSGTLTHIPHPIQSSSEIQAILEAGVASTHSLPVGCTAGFQHMPHHRANQEQLQVHAWPAGWVPVKLTNFDDRAELLALLPALLGLTPGS